MESEAIKNTIERFASLADTQFKRGEIVNFEMPKIDGLRESIQDLINKMEKPHQVNIKVKEQEDHLKTINEENKG